MMFTLLLLLLLNCIGTFGSLNFVSLGDWGSPDDEQSSVAKQLVVIASSANISFVLSLGDNFYEDGVSSDTDPQWETT